MIFAENNCWSLTSCGPIGGLIPTALDEVVFDSCSLTTPKMSADKDIWSLNTTGWNAAGVFQLVSFRLHATDHMTLAAGAFTVTTSTTTSIDTPVLTISNGAKIVCGGSPCGITMAKQMKFYTSSGNVELLGWDRFDTAPVDVRWRMNPTVSTATVHMQLTGVTGSYILSRDGVDLQSATADSAGIQFDVTGGWSTHDMRIYPYPASPGGGGSPPTPPPPASQPTYSSPSGITFYLPFGLVFHDGHILGPGIITVMLLLIAGLIMGIKKVALIVIAIVELAIVFLVSLFLGATVEYVTIIALFAVVALFIGQFMKIGFKNAVILALLGGALMGLFIYLGVFISI